MQFILDPDVNRLGVACAHETATLNLRILALVLSLRVASYAASLPEGRREFSYFALYR